MKIDKEMEKLVNDTGHLKINSNGLEDFHEFEMRLQQQIHVFRCSSRNRGIIPNLIIMHPVNCREFLSNINIQVNDSLEIKYMGIRVYRSEDLKLNEFVVN